VTQFEKEMTALHVLYADGLLTAHELALLTAISTLKMLENHK